MIHTPQHKGILFVVLGTILFSSKAVIVKILFSIGLGPLELQALRMLMILPFYLAVLGWIWYKENLSVTLKDTVWTVLAGIACYHVASFLDLQGLLYISAGLERMILFCYPAISMLLAWLLLREPVTKRMWISLILAYSGVVLFFYGDSSFGGENLLFGSLLIFIASIMTAWFMVANQIYSRRMGSQRFTCIAMLGAVFSLLLHITIQGTEDLTALTLPMYSGALVIAVFCTLIPTFLVSAGVKIVGASKAGIVGAIGPLGTIILSNYLLDEPLSAIHFVGLGLVVLGMRFLK